MNPYGPLGGEGEPALKAFLADPDGTGPARAADQRLLRERLDGLAACTPQGREAIAPRFGLRGGRSKALKEVARAHGITRERIPKIKSPRPAQALPPCRWWLTLVYQGLGERVGLPLRLGPWVVLKPAPRQRLAPQQRQQQPQ